MGQSSHQEVKNVEIEIKGGSKIMFYVQQIDSHPQKLECMITFDLTHFVFILYIDSWSYRPELVLEFSLRSRFFFFRPFCCLISDQQRAAID